MNRFSIFELVKMKLKLILLIINLSFVLSGRCPPEEVYYPCYCNDVINKIVFMAYLYINFIFRITLLVHQIY